MKKYIFILFIILLNSVNTFAQNIDFRASAKNVVTVGEQFQLSFTVNAKGSGLKMPDLSNFIVLSGPNQSSSSSVQIINGQISQSSSYSYTYILQAKKDGKFTIGSAEITVNGKNYKSNPLTIEVVKTQYNNKGNNNINNNGKGGNQDLFVKIDVSRTSVYQGENILATIKIYTRATLVGFEKMKYPSYTGFWSEDIETPSQINLKQENINGTVYNVGLIKKSILYPQRSGTITIDPFVLDCIIQQRVNRNSQSIFDSFFGSYQNVKKSVSSQPITINVKALPANKPDGYSGAVGNFKMDVTADKQNIKTNEAITFKIVLSGVGNFKLIESPSINFPQDFESYDPKITENIKNSDAGSGGTKTFEYLVIPRHSGSFRIAPVVFSYFDPNLRQYKIITSDDFNINVEKGNDNESNMVVSGFTKEDVKLIGSDIRYLKTKINTLHKKNDYLFGSTYFYLSYIISLLFFISIFILRRKQIKQNADKMLVKNRRANRTVKKRLKKASIHLKQNNKEMFYDEILKALWGYLSDKLRIPVADLSKDAVLEIIRNYEFEEDILNNLIHILDACEYARYSPQHEASQMDEIYSDAASLISKFEQKIK